MLDIFEDVAEKNSRSLGEVLSWEWQDILFRNNTLILTSAYTDNIKFTDLDMDGFVLKIKKFKDINKGITHINFHNKITQSRPILTKTAHGSKDLSFMRTISQIQYGGMSMAVSIACKHQSLLAHFSQVWKTKFENINVKDRTRISVQRNSPAESFFKICSQDNAFITHLLDETLDETFKGYDRVSRFDNYVYRNQQGSYKE